MSDIRKRRVCSDEAFAAYMALGPSRSLTRLLKRYRSETGVVPPALSTLKRWSRSEEWQVRAREHDIQVQGETSEKTIEIQASERASVFEGLEDTVQDLLTLLRSTMHDVTIETVEHLKDLSGVIVELSAHGLDLQRGKQPDASLVAALVREKMLGNGSTDRAGQPPTPDELNEAIEQALLDDHFGTEH